MRHSSSILAAFLLLTCPLASMAQQRKVIEPQTENLLVVQMRVDSGGHHVEKVTRATRLVAKQPAVPALGFGFRYSLTDSSGVVQAAGEIADPRIVRGPLPLIGEASQGHVVVQRPIGHYVVHVPQTATGRYLRIENLPTAGMEKRAKPSAQVVDLLPLLKR